MRRWGLCLGFCLALQTPVWAGDIPADILNSAQKRVEYGFNPGLVMAYVEKGQAPVIKAWGQISFQSNAQAVTAQTAFEIGSLTKLFTALEAARLVEAKKLSPEQTLKSLWPEDWGALHASAHPITLQSMLSHSSGLPRLPKNFMPQNPLDPYQDYSQELLSAFLANYQVEKTPATYGYSNFAYGLLGGLLPRYSNSPSYEQMLQQNLLQPLGMNQTSTQDPTAPVQWAQPHYEGAPVLPWHFTEVTTGAGSLRSTGQDMALFLQAQLAPPEGLVGQAIQRSHQVLLEDRETVAYGWHLRVKDDQTLYTHNGLTGGSLSFIGLDLKAGKGAVILTNNTDAVVDLGLRLLDGKTALRPLKDPRLPENTLKAYTGTYQLAPNLLFTVTQSAGYLIVELTGQPALRVYPGQKPHAFAYRIVEAELEFKANAQGQIEGVTLHQGGKSSYAPRRE